MNTTVGKFRESVGHRVALVKKWAAFEVWNRVTLKNPVDTGRSRAAWNLAVGTADLTTPAAAKSVPPPRVPNIGEVPLGAAIVVSNNVPYILALEKGHSTQAPDGFVRASLDEVVGASAGQIAHVKHLGETGAL